MVNLVRSGIAMLTLSFGMFVAGVSAAGELPVPRGEILLTVSGNIGVTNAEGSAVFDAEMLAALGEDVITTTTIWTDGVQEFRGVSLAALVKSLGVTSGTLTATAINDYIVEIPVSDAIEGGPILAYENNGQAMSVRDKGPLWLVYPYDSDKAYQTEVIYSRSIWQLVKIVFAE